MRLKDRFVFGYHTGGREPQHRAQHHTQQPHHQCAGKTVNTGHATLRIEQ